MSTGKLIGLLRNANFEGRLAGRTDAFAKVARGHCDTAFRRKWDIAAG